MSKSKKTKQNKSGKQNTSNKKPVNNNSGTAKTAPTAGEKAPSTADGESTAKKSTKQKKPLTPKARQRLHIAVGLFAAACLLLAGIVWIFFHNNALAVKVGDVQVGIIAANQNVTSESFNKLITAKMKEIAGNNLEVTDTITLVPVHSSKKKIENIETVLSSVCGIVTYNQEAIAINVNGEQYVVVANQEIADRVLADALEAYDLPAGTSDPEFADKVETEPVYTDGSTVVAENVALSKMTAKETESRVHTVSSGETFAGIASSFGLTMDELLALNPDVSSDDVKMVQVGQQLNVTVKVPIVSVKSFSTVTTEEEIPYDTETVENDNETTDYRVVLTEGENGKKEVTERVIYVNGIKKDTEVQSEKVITEPVNEVVEIGTLEENARTAMGNFIFPVTGIISSVFGERDYGSGYHYGLDIAADGGNPVHAAAAGTVTFAGWNSGGYGYLVIINHNNGFVTYYAHNSSLCVQKGDTVEQGTTIARVGTTGDSTGNHCHFEIIRNGTKVDPLNYLSVY